MGPLKNLRRPLRALVDFALPPRCAGCGAVVDTVHTFCVECWTSIEFMQAGCAQCGMPLEATDLGTCAACMARPPRIERTRAAVLYDDLTRALVVRLKYGRKVGLAKTMAHYMAPHLVDLPPDALLVPVPLHRRRLWQRGFNQSGLLAAELGKRSGLRSAEALERTKRTPPLKGMTRLQRRKAVAGAFRIRSSHSVSGRVVVLIDDVLTTGSTANGCARALLRAGASRVEYLSWARVIRPVVLE